MYRPPDTRLCEFSETLTKLDTCLSSLPSPTPTIALMGDFNFPRQAIVWSRCGDSDESTSGDLVPLVARHREGEKVGGKQDRLQAEKLCDFATRSTVYSSK